LGKNQGEGEFMAGGLVVGWGEVGCDFVGVVRERVEQGIGEGVVVEVVGEVGGLGGRGGWGGDVVGSVGEGVGRLLKLGEG
uniref:hypothetical protein n=1 Tax=Corynebacterium glyciniphilum TaxID=1404244 RepID=UPI001C92CE01